MLSPFGFVNDYMHLPGKRVEWFEKTERYTKFRVFPHKSRYDGLMGKCQAASTADSPTSPNIWYNTGTSINGNDPQFWTHNYQSPRFNAWRGLSFERVCFWHIPQIKASLGISGIGSDVYSWRGKDEDGRSAQIDMLIDRADGTVSVCEMKYGQEKFDMTAEEAEKVRRRGVLFSRATKSHKAIQNVLISCFGINRSKYSGVIHREVTLDDLFKE